ncbi:MAG: dihydrofolate reductase [Fusobacteriota bacterium]
MVKNNIEMIAAMGKNRVIGKDNSMPWDIPGDLKHFKSITLNHRVVMGKNTYQSIGKPLVNRENIILSRSRNFQRGEKNIKVYNSINRVIKESNNKKTFIIGGENIYKQFLNYCSKIHLTLIDKNIPGDKFFPVLDDKIWKLVDKSPQNNYKEYSYFFLTYNRREGS